jgi:intron-binding protein aquarius
LGGSSDDSVSGDSVQGSGDAQLVKLFGQLLGSVQFYLRFEIDEQSGQALGDTEMAARHYAKMQRLQRLAFRHLQADCPDLCLRSVASLDSRAELTRLLAALPEPKLRLLCGKLALPVSEPHQTPGARRGLL